MDNEKKIADLKADLNADTNPDLNIAETMAEGIPEHNTIDTICKVWTRSAILNKIHHLSQEYVNG